MNYPNLAIGTNASLKTAQSQLGRWLSKQALRSIGPAPLRFVLRGKGDLFSSRGSPVATVIVNDLATLAQLILDPEMAFGDGYADGRIEVQGDLVEALEAVYTCWPEGRAGSSWLHHFASNAMSWLQDNSPDKARANIHRHYDLGNDFYKLWLDSQMVYTCAYFSEPSMTLEEAQQAKLDYVCRKLQLQPGETVVEAGCGWGALARHMAERYGVSVRAFNISHEQIVYARYRARERGLASRVEFVEDDYRNIQGQYDVFASVGMLEHVGVPHFPEFANLIDRVIGHRGRGLIHYIGKSYPGDFSRWIRKRIFPGASAPALADALRILEPHQYAVTDVENLRLHYAKTVEHWLERFNRSSGQIRAMYDPWFERAWRLYLAGSVAAFRTGSLQLFQITFAGPQCGKLAWTRAPLYMEAKPWTAATS